MSAGPAIAMDGVDVSYGRLEVLRDVTLGVSTGSVFALLGRNGSGKSSLVRCLLGLQHTSRGRIDVFGQDAWRARLRLMTRVGVVPEEPDGPPDLRVGEMLQLVSGLYPRWDAARLHERLRRFDVALHQPFGRLSRGQKGWVMLALALAHSPELLVLDDPTLGLDVVARRALYDEVIAELAERGTTIFLTTHDLAGVERLVDHVAILQGHGLVLQEELDTLRLRCRAIRVTGSALPADRARFQPFDVRRLTPRPWGTEILVTNFDEDALRVVLERVGARDAEVDAVSLEDIFQAYAGEAGGAA